MTTPFVQQNSYTKEELLACGRGELFGAGNAQLPMPNMLMIDRILDINSTGGKYGKGEIVAELDINPDLWFFGCHFEGDPVMPGCLGLDAMWQLVGFYLGWTGAPGRGRALGCAEVKFSGQVLPKHKKNHLPHPHQTRDEQQTGAGHRRCRNERGRPQKSMKATACASACSHLPTTSNHLQRQKAV